MCNRDTPRYLTSTQAMDDLRHLNAAFIENYVRNDVAAHDCLLHPDFLYVGASGQRVDRATYLRNWATGFDPRITIYWDVRDELITLAGDVALVRASNKEVNLVNGREHTAMWTYTDIYQYRHGAWTCLQAQISPVADQHRPTDKTIISIYLRGVKQ